MNWMGYVPWWAHFPSLIVSVMKQELGIYENTIKSRKKSFYRFYSDRSLQEICGYVVAIGMVFLCVWLSYRFISSFFSVKSSPVVQRVNNEKVNVPQPQITKEVFNLSDGTTEEYVTTSIITSPYTWDFAIDDITLDNTPVSVHLLITSQVLQGHAKELLRNYGGNWFYTAFLPVYLPSIKSYCKSLSLPLVTNQFECALADSANVQIKRISEKYPLPVVIQQVKVVSVYKK